MEVTFKRGLTGRNLFIRLYIQRTTGSEYILRSSFVFVYLQHLLVVLVDYIS